jgi:predicted Rossmann fold nucleotide-binding protein DprA/Smf involved in DNA uptake
MRYRTDDSHHRKPVASLQLSEREQIVMSAFDGEPVEVDFLSATMGIGGAELRGILLGLEFRGIVVSVPGNKYQIA